MVGGGQAVESEGGGIKPITHSFIGGDMVAQGHEKLKAYFGVGWLPQKVRGSPWPAKGAGETSASGGRIPYVAKKTGRPLEGLE